MNGLPFIKIQEAKRKVCPFRVFKNEEDLETLPWMCEADECMKWVPSPKSIHRGRESFNADEYSKTHGRCGA